MNPLPPIPVSGIADSGAYCPDPETIRAECLRIQESWTPKDYARRARWAVSAWDIEERIVPAAPDKAR
jgi:hypothetical protein